MPVTHGVAGSSPVQTAKKPNATRWAFCIQVRSKTGFSVVHECKKHPHRRCRASLLCHPQLGPPRRGSAAGNPVSCPGLQLRSMRKGGLPCRASLLGQMTIPVLCKLLWDQRSHCFLLRRNCKRRGWTPRATSASNQSAPARLQIPLMLLRYSSRSF